MKRANPKLTPNMQISERMQKKEKKEELKITSSAFFST